MYFWEAEGCFFRQKKIKTNQGLRPCSRKFYNSMLLRSSPSVATLRKVTYNCSIFWKVTRSLPLFTFASDHRERNCKGGAVSGNSDQRYLLATLFSIVVSRRKEVSHLVYVFSAPEEQWNKLFLEGLTLGKGEVTPDELSSVIKKRVERTLIRTVSNIKLCSM